MADVFISYRRKSCGDLACLLRDRLQRRGFEVFLDVYCLGRGDYREALQQQIRECTHFIVLLAPGDMERCKNEEDVFRQEIEFAFEYKKNIVPLFKREFVFPEVLPKTINKLPDENGMEISIEWMDAQIQKLTEKFLIPEAEPEQNGMIIDNVTLPEHRRYGAVDEPITQFTGKTLAEMASVARSDVTHNAALFQTIYEAEHDDADAQLALAESYLFSKKPHCDPEKAIYWLCLAIDHKITRAMYLLGLCYSNGSGVTQNDALAVYWYEQGASQSWPCVDAVFKMAECCRHGIGIEADCFMKAKWYRKAMEFEEPENAETYRDVLYTAWYINILRDPRYKKKLKAAGYSIKDVEKERAERVADLSRKTWEDSGLATGLIVVIVAMCGVLVRASAFENTSVEDLGFAVISSAALMALDIIFKLKMSGKLMKIIAFPILLLIIAYILFMVLKATAYAGCLLHPIPAALIGGTACVVLVWGIIRWC